MDKPVWHCTIAIAKQVFLARLFVKNSILGYQSDKPASCPKCKCVAYFFLQTFFLQSFVLLSKFDVSWRAPVPDNH